MTDPINRRGEWWTPQPNGGWLKWDENGAEWQRSAVPPPPPHVPAVSAASIPSSTAAAQTVSPTRDMRSFRLEKGSARRDGWTLVVVGALGGIFLSALLFVLAPIGGALGVVAAKRGEDRAREVIFGSALFTAVGLLVAATELLT